MKIKNLSWHEYYKNFNGFSVKYLPEDIYFIEIIPNLNNQSLRNAYADKNMYDKNFPEFRTPKTYLRNINGRYLNTNYLNVNEKIIFEELKDGEYIIKPSLDTCGGKNVEILNKKDNKFMLGNNIIKINDLLKKYYKNFIIQEKIKQHNLLERIHPSSLNTIRITSYRYMEEITILSAVLRMGSGGSRVDNASKGGIIVGIDLEKGKIKLKDYIYKFSDKRLSSWYKKISEVKLSNFLNI